MVGYAFLESPGNPYDGIDNDGDMSFSDAMFNESDFLERKEVPGVKAKALSDFIPMSGTLFCIKRSPSPSSSRITTRTRSPGGWIKKLYVQSMGTNGDTYSSFLHFCLMIFEELLITGSMYHCLSLKVLCTS